MVCINDGITDETNKINIGEINCSNIKDTISVGDTFVLREGIVILGVYDNLVLYKQYFCVDGQWIIRTNVNSCIEIINYWKKIKP
jgi:hypothetical protein